MSRKRSTLNEKQRTELQVAYDTSRDGLTRARLLGVRLYGEGEKTERILDIREMQSQQLDELGADLSERRRHWSVR